MTDRERAIEAAILEVKRQRDTPGERVALLAELERQGFVVVPVEPASKFRVGQEVYKTGTTYSGPGIVRCVYLSADGKPRYVVGHKIKGGEGEFQHVYTENLLAPKDAMLQAAKEKGDG